MFINTNNDLLQYPGGLLCSLRHPLAQLYHRPAAGQLQEACKGQSLSLPVPTKAVHSSDTAAAADNYYGIVVLEEKDKIVSLPVDCRSVHLVAPSS